MAQRENLLRNIAESFKDLAETANSQTQYIELVPFVRACSLVSPLIGYVGVGFKFAELEYLAKVNDLAEASKSIATLESLLDCDIQNNCARSSNSHSRNLVRVKRSLDMLRVIFDQVLSKGGNSIRGPASTAYKQVFAPYHGWAIRTAVAAGIYALPTKAQIFKKLNEDEASASVQMKNFVDASTSIIQYINKLFLSRESGDDLLGLI